MDIHRSRYSIKEALFAMDEASFSAHLKEINRSETKEEIIMSVLEEMGTLWEQGQVSLAQLYMSGVIVQRFFSGENLDNPQSRGDTRFGVAVLRDFHALGKLMLINELRARGLQVVDLGEGLGVDELIKKTLESQVDVLLISTLMLPSALAVGEVVRGLKEHRSDLWIFAGGAPFRLDPSLSTQVQVHGTAPTATSFYRQWSEGSYQR